MNLTDLHTKWSYSEDDNCDFLSPCSDIDKVCDLRSFEEPYGDCKDSSEVRRGKSFYTFYRRDEDGEVKRHKYSFNMADMNKFIKNLNFDEESLRCKIGSDYATGSFDWMQFSDKTITEITNAVDRSEADVIGFIFLTEPGAPMYCEVASVLFRYWESKWNSDQGIMMNKNMVEDVDHVMEEKRIVLTGEEEPDYFLNFPLRNRVYITRQKAESIASGQHNFYVLIPTNFRFIDTNPTGVGVHHNYFPERGDYGDTVYYAFPVGSAERQVSQQIEVEEDFVEDDTDSISIEEILNLEPGDPEAYIKLVIAILYTYQFSADEIAEVIFNIENEIFVINHDDEEILYIETYNGIREIFLHSYHEYNYRTDFLERMPFMIDDQERYDRIANAVYNAIEEGTVEQEVDSVYDSIEEGSVEQEVDSVSPEEILNLEPGDPERWVKLVIAILYTYDFSDDEIGQIKFNIDENEIYVAHHDEPRVTSLSITTEDDEITDINIHEDYGENLLSDFVESMPLEIVDQERYDRIYDIVHNRIEEGRSTRRRRE